LFGGLLFFKPSAPGHLAKIRDQECLDFVITHNWDEQDAAEQNEQLERYRDPASETHPTGEHDS